MKKLRLEYHLIDKCNLNCKSCSHFSNVVKEEKIKTIEQIENDFKKIWELTDKGNPLFLEKVTLMGGEPLLYPHIEEAIDLIKSMFPHEYDLGPLQLITNGLLLHKQNPGFFKCLRRNNVVVCVSIYGIDFSKYEEIFNILDSEKIRWYWYKAYNTEDKRFSTKWLHTHFDKNYKEYAKDCGWRLTCTQLVDNKIYQCSMIAYFKYFDEAFKDKHNFKITEDDYIDLNKINTFEELMNAKEKIPPFCGYCRGSHAISEPWDFTRGTIDEYVFDE